MQDVPCADPAGGPHDRAPLQRPVTSVETPGHEGCVDAAREGEAHGGRRTRIRRRCGKGGEQRAHRSPDTAAACHDTVSPAPPPAVDEAEGPAASESAHAARKRKQRSRRGLKKRGGGSAEGAPYTAEGSTKPACSVDNVPYEPGADAQSTQGTDASFALPCAVVAAGGHDAPADTEKPCSVPDKAKDGMEDGVYTCTPLPTPQEIAQPVDERPLDECAITDSASVMCENLDPPATSESTGAGGAVTGPPAQPQGTAEGAVTEGRPVEEARKRKRRNRSRKKASDAVPATAPPELAPEVGEPVRKKRKTRPNQSAKQRRRRRQGREAGVAELAQRIPLAEQLERLQAPDPLQAEDMAVLKDVAMTMAREMSAQDGRGGAAGAAAAVEGDEMEEAVEEEEAEVEEGAEEGEDGDASSDALWFPRVVKTDPIFCESDADCGLSGPPSTRRARSLPTTPTNRPRRLPDAAFAAPHPSEFARA
eukprot:TRINITY_DN447_c2_g1_i2.p1 TRINITY_DN447_c2_g1~~TRINITY_DN447_c2_g1_i2.p1  ORF type:complete len:479 (+),score=87.52 TRINITY_DN447_c2_g1_i2:79-1515(+)